MPNDPPPPNDASHPPPRSANSLGMFFLLLPAAIWIANGLAAYWITAWPGGSPNSAARFILVVDAPLALIGATIAMAQALRCRDGGSAFCKALAWNLLLVVAFWIIFGVKLGSELRR
jgi:hypothetical protein